MVLETGRHGHGVALDRAILLLATVGLATVLTAGCAASGPSGGNAAAPAQPQTPGTQAATPTPATPSAPAPPATPRAAASPSVIPVPPPPARLHQTRAFPSTRTRAFRGEMTDLWTAVTTGHPGPAVQAFFPLTAYTQVKAIAAPAADWRHRLLGSFRLDIAAAHRFLGHGARRARLVRVIVPSAQAAWIDPGVCANSVGYWHVAGARLVYRQHGHLRSIGIASLISWRGRWYVVHFGAVLRTGTTGIVDSPAAGPGSPGPPGGC